MSTFEDRIQDLVEIIEQSAEEYNENPPYSQDEENEFCQDGLIDPLSQMAEILREAEAAAYPKLAELIEQTDIIFNRTLNWAHGDTAVLEYYDDEDEDEDEDDGDDANASGPYSESCMPSFAHGSENAPLLKDPRRPKNTHGFVGTMLPNLHLLAELLPGGVDVEALKSKLLKGVKDTVAWRKTLRPHPLSTPCSRFLDDIPEWTATDQNQHATSVAQARCEITSREIRLPSDMRLSSTGNILAFSAMGGWKNRVPYLHYQLPNEETGADSINSYSIKVDLMSGLREMLIDDERRLLFASDWDRVRSYRCKEPNVPRDAPSGSSLRVHTLNSKGYSGPLAMLPNGRLAKAGKGQVAIWDLDSLQTHGATGKDVVGDKLSESEMMDTGRDDPENIERSRGSEATIVIDLPSIDSKTKNNVFEIEKWHQHPSQAGTLICGTDRKSKNYLCHSLDFEAGGKTVTRYLGHGDSVNDFSTSAGDPNVFLTSCSDGHARLYDVRHPLPTMTLTTYSPLEAGATAVLAHPDGIPFVFTGAQEGEHIKVWDLRARAFVYELATGNNYVESMAWDANSNSLYAATSCPNIGYTGAYTNYRLARIPKINVAGENDGDDSGDEGVDSEDEIEEENEYRCWPQRAHQAENHFGHVFDAGEHRLYKYSFKMDPNSNILPHYGAATTRRSSMF